MKPYLTFFFIILGLFSLIFIYLIDVFWSGIIASFIACICLVFAIYFARYITK